jgi:rhodanese-related sulfurtransferase
VVPALCGFLIHWQSGKLPKLRAPEVLVEEAQKWEGTLWVDARSREDYEAKHVEGAVWLNEGEWQEGLPAVLDEWMLGRRVVVYCSSRSCQASHAVARRLREETGWQEIFVLKGGWNQ